MLSFVTTFEWINTLILHDDGTRTQNNNLYKTQMPTQSTVVRILKLAVLSSTNATDMDAIVDAIRYEGLDAQIAVVASNRKCPALDRAKGFGIPAHFVDPAGKTKEEYDKALYEAIAPYKPDLILLIGYMRFLTQWFVDKYGNRIMNIHPSLLPEFAGGMDLNVHEEVLKAGKSRSGATLHFVDETPDGGPIIFQKEVQIALGETPKTLKEKVQQAEGELIVKAVDLFGKGKIKVSDGKVTIQL